MKSSRESDLCNVLIDLVDTSMNRSDQEVRRNESHQGHGSLHEQHHSSGSENTGGFCVKDYENRLSKLTKENFNLKLRLYFLEEKNPNIPQGAEALYKENIDLKVENESYVKDMQEKQNLLIEAYKAIEMLDEERSSDLEVANEKIEELNQKITAMHMEIESLEAQLLESKESNLGNDTGFTEFLGAVDGNKDVDSRRMKSEWKEKENQLKAQIQSLENDKEMLTAKIAELKTSFENAGQKSQQEEIKMKKEMSVLEADLKEFKDRWASNECDLQDAEEKIKQMKVEELKAYELLKQTLQNLKKERAKVSSLENKITELDTSTGRSNKDSLKNFTNATIEEYRQEVNTYHERNHKLEENLKELNRKSQMNMKKLEHVIKEQENDLTTLRIELSDVKKKLKACTTQDLQERNRQISDLSNLMKNMQFGRNSLSRHSRVSSSPFLEKASESFNELQFQQAMHQKKITQDKINTMMKDLANTANSQTKAHVKDLQDQLAILMQKQEVADSALETYSNICSLTFNHLNELAQFLATLIKQEHIQNNLEDSTIFKIQNILDKTMEFSQRLSIDNRMSFDNISMLEVLMDSTRMSIANIKEIKTLNVSMQTSDDCELKKINDELTAMNRVNQLLEDEIVGIKETLTTKNEEINDFKNKLSSLQHDMDVKIAESEKLVKTFEGKISALETKLKQETETRIQAYEEAAKNERKATITQNKFEKLQKDLEENWVSKMTHVECIDLLQKELISNEAQIAAIQMELDNKISDYEELRLSAENITPRRTLEISDDRMKLILGNSSSCNVIKTTENVPSTTKIETETENVKDLENSANAFDVDLCPQCPVLKTKMNGYKKYLSRAVDKLKAYESVKKVQDRLIQSQLNRTTSVLQNVATNMENLPDVKSDKK